MQKYAMKKTKLWVFHYFAQVSRKISRYEICSLSCHSLLVLISNIGSQILSDVWSLLTHPLCRSDIMQQFLFSHAAYRSTPNNHMMCVVK